MRVGSIAPARFFRVEIATAQAPGNLDLLKRMFDSRFRPYAILRYALAEVVEMVDTRS